MSNFINWSPGTTLASVERQVIMLAMKFYRNDLVTVSNALGLTKRNLEKKIEQYENEQAAIDKKLEERRVAQEEFNLRSRGTAMINPQGYKQL